MQPVEGQWTIVGSPREIVDAVESRAIAGGAQGAAPRPIEAEKEAFGEPPVHAGLQRVVIRSTAELMHNNVPETRVRSQEVGVKGLRARVGPLWACAGGKLRAVLILRQERGTVRDGVQISSLQLMAILRAHIRSIQNEIHGQLGLHAEMVALCGRSETIEVEGVQPHRCQQDS